MRQFAHRHIHRFVQELGILVARTCRVHLVHRMSDGRGGFGKEIGLGP